MVTEYLVKMVPEISRELPIKAHSGKKYRKKGTCPHQPEQGHSDE